MSATRKPLGRLLVDAGLVTQSALDGVLQDQASDGRRLGEILVARNLVTDVQLTQILSHQLSLPWVSLATIVPEPTLLAMLPKSLVEHHHIVPIYVRRDRKRSVLYVASDDPTRESALRECSEAAGMDVRTMVAATLTMSAPASRARRAISASSSGLGVAAKSWCETTRVLPFKKIGS